MHQGALSLLQAIAANSLKACIQAPTSWKHAKTAPNGCIEAHPHGQLRQHYPEQDRTASAADTCPCRLHHILPLTSGMCTTQTTTHLSGCACAYASASATPQLPPSATPHCSTARCRRSCSQSPTSAVVWLSCRQPRGCERPQQRWSSSTIL